MTEIDPLYRIFMPHEDPMVVARVASVLAIFPKDSLQRIAAMGVRIRILAAEQRYDEVSSTLRAAGDALDRWPVLPSGLFVPSERTVYLRSLACRTITHEFGHVYDFLFGNGVYLSSYDLAVQTAFATAQRFVTPYAAVRIDEYFAEAVRAFFGGKLEVSGQRRVTRRHLRACDPRLERILADLFSAENATPLKKY